MCGNPFKVLKSVASIIPGVGSLIQAKDAAKERKKAGREAKRIAAEEKGRADGELRQQRRDDFGTRTRNRTAGTASAQAAGSVFGFRSFFQRG